MSTKNDMMWVAETGRKYLRGGLYGQISETPMWPERNLGDLWRAGALAAEVAKALDRPEVSVVPAAPIVAPPPPPEPQISLAEAARQAGISPAAMLKRKRRCNGSLVAAIAMGGKMTSRWQNGNDQCGPRQVGSLR